MKNINPLIKLFERYAYGQNYSAAFSAMLDYFLIAFKYYKTEEDQAAAIHQLTTYQKKDEHIALLTEIGELSEGFEDPLGDLYEQLISKGKNGQFFTPEPVAHMIATSIINEDMEAGKTVYDPACGSGRMLLAAAKINRHLLFYGADIDPLCCKMSLVNMLLNSLTAEIAQMDTLSNTFYKGYKTGTIIKDGYHYPWYREFTDPEESYIWLRPTPKPTAKGFDTAFEPTKSPLMSEGVQGNLFEQE
jgi:type I restriction-modification system DNA methylase subunit